MNLFYYNPFLRLTNRHISDLVQAGTSYVVIQRFEWPGIPKGKGFMLCAYRDKDVAQEHAEQMAEKEGKMQDLSVPEEYSKVIALTADGSAYQVFYNKSMKEVSDNKMLKAYARNISAYIKRIRLPKEGGYQVSFYVEYGRVKATITSGEKIHTGLFYEMIK